MRRAGGAGAWRDRVLDQAAWRRSGASPGELPARPDQGSRPGRACLRP